MSRSTQAALLANNGVIALNPDTKELRPAGTYSQNEWTALSRANPDLATALIENRARRKEVANAQESKRSLTTFAGGLLAGGALMESVGQSVVHNNLVKALNWHENTLVPQGTVIYQSDHSLVHAPQNGVVEFMATPGLNQQDARNEAIRARGAFREFAKSPEGQKLYRGVPADDDPVRLDQKARIYEAMGFDEMPNGVMRKDMRPGAEQFKHFYRIGDQAMHFADINSLATARGLRYGGAAIAGLTLGGIAHGAWNMINPIQEV